MFAFFIGGPADGQRHAVDSLPPIHEIAVFDPPGGVARRAHRITTKRAVYTMLQPPLNPHRATGGSRALNVEIGVYHITEMYET